MMQASIRPSAAMPPRSRTALVVGSVVLLHGAALWALQSGLLQRAVEVVVPVQRLVAELATPPTQPVAPPEVQPPRPVPPPPRPVLRQTPPPPKPAPAPVPAPALPTAIPDRSPAPTAVTGTPEPQPAPPPVSAPVAVAAPAPQAAAKVELPITDADYLDNPKPEWPRLSQRLGERGRVVLRVLIGPDGKARQVQVKESSGFPRLDSASIAAVQAARYVPGKRGGVPEEMWVNIPFWWGDKDNDGEKKQ